MFPIAPFNAEMFAPPFFFSNKNSNSSSALKGAIWSNDPEDPLGQSVRLILLGSVRYWREIEDLEQAPWCQNNLRKYLSERDPPTVSVQNLLGSRPPIRASCLCAHWASEWRMLLESVDRHSVSACPVRSRPNFYATMTHRRRRNTARHDQNDSGHWVIVGKF